MKDAAAAEFLGGVVAGGYFFPLLFGTVAAHWFAIHK
jgi:hypothetical protein